MSLSNPRTLSALRYVPKAIVGSPLSSLWKVSRETPIRSANRTVEIRRRRRASLSRCPKALICLSADGNGCRNALGMSDSMDIYGKSVKNIGHFRISERRWRLATEVQARPFPRCATFRLCPRRSSRSAVVVADSFSRPGLRREQAFRGERFGRCYGSPLTGLRHIVPRA